MISSVSSFSAGLPQPIDFGAGTNGHRNTTAATRQGDAVAAESSGDSETAQAENGDTAAERLGRRDVATEGADNESADGLTDEERAIVAELRQTDRAVRAHEQAHLAAAGALARGVSFSFITGPDGQQYAVGGEVSIDTSPVAGDPEATIRKAQQIRAAANAPADPSGQDRAVAAAAGGLEQTARQELAAEQRAEFEEQRRAQVEQQNRQSQAGAFGQSPAPSPKGHLLSLIA